MDGGKEISLHDETVKVLHAKCIKREIKGHWSMKKNEMIHALMSKSHKTYRNHAGYSGKKPKKTLLSSCTPCKRGTTMIRKRSGKRSKKMSRKMSGKKSKKMSGKRSGKRSKKMSRKMSRKK